MSFSLSLKYLAFGTCVVTGLVAWRSAHHKQVIANWPSTSAADINSVAPVEFPRQDVTKKELYCAEQEFTSKVHWGTSTSHAPFTGPTPRFTVGSFQGLLPNQSCSGENELGLLVRFGGDAGELKFAYRFVCMDLTLDHGNYVGNFTEIDPGDDVVYETDNSGALGVGQTVAQWDASNGKGFQDNVWVDKDDTGHFSKIYGTAAGHAVYRVSAIVALIADNSLDSTDFVEVVPVAEPLVWAEDDKGEGFSMHTCLVAFDTATNERVINNASTPTGSFAQRGSDLGSACPPICGSALEFPATGVLLRKSCIEQ